MEFPALISPNLSACSVDFQDGEEFRRALLQKGLRVWWEQYLPCPCRHAPDAVDGVAEVRDAPDPDCVGCAGTARLYVAGQQIPSMVQAAERNQKWFTAMGPVAPGTMLLSVLPEHLTAMGDRITLLDGVMVMTELRVRGDRTTDTMPPLELTRYPIIKRSVTVGGTPPTTPVPLTVGVVYLRGANASGVLQPELVEGTDFDLALLPGTTDSYGIDFKKGDTLGTAPAVGSTYSVRYHARPRFIVGQEVHARRGLYDWGSETATYYDFPTTFAALFEHLAGTQLGTQPTATVHPGSGY